MALDKITFHLDLFKRTNDKERSRKCILWLMESLVQINKTFISKYKPPSLYKSEVIYEAEETEIWKDIPSIIRDGNGDCEDLACWRIAELQAVGIKARPYIKWRKVKDSWIYHALVWRPGNKIEDPSLALGMNGSKVIRKPIFVKP